MEERDRQKGWVHAKLSGHKNEDLVTSYVCERAKVQEDLVKIAKKSGRFVSISEGGLHEKGIQSVLGGSTKAKPDLYLLTDKGEYINVSLKKSSGGQVYLITVERFIAGFEKQYQKAISDDVRRAISLYWGSVLDTQTIIHEYAVVEKAYQVKKHRLVFNTLQRYNANLSSVLLDWFKENIAELFDFCFIRGLASNPKCWANVIWYKNLLPGEEEEVQDTMLNLEDLREKIKNHTNLVEYGTRTGGSTIQLPFGFVQWHQGQMQFHHNEEKILKLIKNRTIKEYKFSEENYALASEPYFF
ncbi:MAG: hypothetical protein J6V61_03160 [Bacteroidaceae bacterium]|nr:hypothetical protein [Bacteroidaceae bacterium]